MTLSFILKNNKIMVHILKEINTEANIGESNRKENNMNIAEFNG